MFFHCPHIHDLADTDLPKTEHLDAGKSPARHNWGLLTAPYKLSSGHLHTPKSLFPPAGRWILDRDVELRHRVVPWLHRKAAGELGRNSASGGSSLSSSYDMWFFLLYQPLVVVCVILQHVHFCFCFSSSVLTVVITQQTAGRWPGLLLLLCLSSSKHLLSEEGRAVSLTVCSSVLVVCFCCLFLFHFDY